MAECEMVWEESKRSTELHRALRGTRYWYEGCTDLMFSVTQIFGSSGCGKELMTCWQARLTGQINTDNLFAESTVLSQP